jgi:hypothetical protein
MMAAVEIPRRRELGPAIPTWGREPYPGYVVPERWEVQMVRLIDVFILGPAMIYLSIRAKNVNVLVRSFVGFSGGMTILYNGLRYLQVEKMKRSPYV